jgi:hypothetical protein
VILAAWIEATPTLRTLAPTTHVLINRQHVFALPTKYRLLVPPGFGPDARYVRLACVVTTDTRVKLLTAEMLDGDDVEGRVPVGALGEWCDGETVYY